MEKGDKHSGNLFLGIFAVMAGLYLLITGYTIVGIIGIGIGLWLVGK
ncbi:MAG TPA: hypothetical protein VJJ75_02090 [Candidatus Nanoarchaeia archaeon]|nr:hypothetical protein [Candidatus Nanoarchaeia archaeon]